MDSKDIKKPADKNAANLANKTTAKTAATENIGKKPATKASSPTKAAEKSTEKKAATAKKPAKSVEKATAAKTEKATIAKAEKATIAKKEPAAKNATEVKQAEKKTKNVLYVCSEAQPFIGTGGLSDVMGALPKSINRKKDGVEVRVILPLYDGMNHDFKQRLEFMFHITVPVSWRKQYCGLFKLEHEGVVYYFVDNEYYFKRQAIYGHYDDGERFAFFSRAVLEILPLIDFKVDVLHCHDWHTALVPIYYKLFYQFRPSHEGIKTIFTIHNIEYQGKYDSSITEDVLGIPFIEYPSIEFEGTVNLMKGAIDYSDVVTTVSPTYAQELCDPYYAYGLEKIIQNNSFKMKGILNGIDTELYDPKTNPSLFSHYDEKSLEGKRQNKIELQKMIGLHQSPDTPLIAIVSRLVPHKGLDLLKIAMHDILSRDVQLVILGTGLPSLEEYFSHIQLEFSGKISTVIAFNKDLSQKIYAGADMFLMPSKGEPCGLSQMIAMRYGTIPIVRATGGLKDTVRDCGDGEGNGFTFHFFESNELTRAVNRATELYKNDSNEWHNLVVRAMGIDFSWNKSADEYIKLYI